MDSYEKLDNETLCFALVGQFMWHWSMLERTVDQALGNALDLTYMQMTVLSDHIKFVDKLKILTGAVTLATFKADERKGYHATIDGLLILYRDRNIVAHHQFGPLEDKRGVTFFTRQTKKTVKLNEEFWDETQCLVRFMQIAKAEAAIMDLSKSMEKQKAGFATRLAKLMAPSGPYGAKLEMQMEAHSGIEGLLRGAPPEDTDEQATGGDD
ncbi:hypothetical protein CO653_33415 [Rhizobium anhuiense]|uniref:hypothetical protein n=1 Tax=Rhizobium anhuiense TaxID=1184720 RepID=UPI000BEA0CDE|nr:hypothetical protein [Rhizobium anhuiense]PDS61400.1 hypothetical protein CO653_33415 [Rhizobium anhuiense]